MLWGEAPPATAAKNLQVLIGRVRALLGSSSDAPPGAGVIISDAGGYRLDPARCRIDAVEFEQLVATGRALGETGRWGDAAATLGEALSMVRGEPVADVAYEPWAAPHARRLAELVIAAHEMHVAAELELGRHETLVARLTALVAAHPLRERLRAQLILALYRSGRQADALDAWQQAHATLRDELGIEPGHELRELQRRILEQDPGLDSPAASPRRTLPAPPAPRTRTLGRDADLASLSALVLGGDARLVTITGWGGTGKTRLACELGRAVRDRFEDVGYVELAPVAETALVPSALEAAFGITQSEGDAVDAIARFLGDRRLLLVLDNFEHVLDASPIVARLLASCANLTVVVTSRSRLGEYGEHEFVLEPLELPEPEAFDDVAGLRENPALRLFEARAREARPAFAIDDSNAAEVARICERVDGLPLGIELAAARVKLLSPADILARLDHRLTLLTSGSRSLPPRQRSLRAAIEWSYDLLSPIEQQVFRMVGVFAGGWSIPAAFAVAGADGAAEIDVLDALEALVDRSLIRRSVEPEGTTRMSMLETIGEYARDLLASDDRESTWRHRHARHFLAVAERGCTHRSDAHGMAARHALHRDLQNIHAAVGYELEEEPELAGRIMVALGRHYRTEGSINEGAELVRRVLTYSDAISDATLAPLLLLAGDLEFSRAEGRAARALLERAVELGAAVGDDATHALALASLAELEAQNDDFERARRLCEDALAIARDLHDRWLIARILVVICHVEADSILGGLDAGREAKRLMELEQDTYWVASLRMSIASILKYTGDIDEAMVMLAETIDELRSLGHVALASHAMTMEMRGLIEQRKFSEAARQSVDTIATTRDGGNSLVLIFGLTMQSVAFLKTDRLDEAREAALESLTIARRTGGFRFAYYAFVVLGSVALASPHVELSAKILGAIDPEYWDDTYDLDRWMSTLASDLLSDLKDNGHRDASVAWAELNLAEKVDLLIENMSSKSRAGLHAAG